MLSVILFHNRMDDEIVWQTTFGTFNLPTQMHLGPNIQISNMNGCGEVSLSYFSYPQFVDLTQEVCTVK